MTFDVSGVISISKVTNKTKENPNVAVVSLGAKSSVNFSNVDVTPKLKQNYLDCFNKAICDIGTISDLLPSLIILPEKTMIIDKKIAAAEVAFASTWKEPQAIRKEVNSNEQLDNIHCEDQTDEVIYDNPNGCNHTQSKQL